MDGTATETLNAIEAPATLLTEVRDLLRQLNERQGVVPALLDVRQAAALLGVCPKTVKRLVKLRRLPGCVCRVGRALRFRRATLLRLVEEKARL